MRMYFNELCPTWSRRLEEAEPYDINKHREYLKEMDKFDRCIVGEAYKFKNDYYQTCIKCLKYAQEFAIRFSTYRNGMNSLVEEFVEHFNENHVEKTPVKLEKKIEQT